MKFRVINILLLLSLLGAGALNLNALLQPLNAAFDWHLRIPIGGPNVTQEFRYWAPAAGEVYLIWGSQGWQQVPEAFRPPGTVVEFGVLSTPMQRDGDTFVTQLQLPVGTILDYGFQTRTTRDGTAAAWIWDGDYQETLMTDNLIEAQGFDLVTQGQGGVQHAGAPIVTPQFRPLIPPAILFNIPVLAWFRNYTPIYQTSYVPLGVLLAGISAIVIGGSMLVARGTATGSETVTATLRRWIYLRDLLGELVGREMKLRYRRSLLGIAWSLINPLLQLLIFIFVFHHVLPLGIPNYTLFLFSGLLVWNWLQGSLMGATTAIIDGGNLLRHPGFPTTILPVVTVVANFVHFLFALPILLLFLWFSGIAPTTVLWFLPVVMALQFLFTLGLAYFLATLHVSLRDTQHLVVVALLFFFYLTPIFYDATMVPARFQGLYDLNPMLHLVQAYRTILLAGELPTLTPLIKLTLFTALLLFWGYQVFTRASYQFVEEL